MPDFLPDSELTLQPCDIFLTRGSGFVAKAIRFFTQSFGEDRTKANHVGIIVEPGTVHTAMEVEALTMVRRHPLFRYTKKRTTGVAVFRPISLTDGERDKIVEKANDYVGRKYGWTKIVTHMMDWGLKGAYVFRRLTHDDNYPICSWVVAYAYDAAGRRFGVDPGAADPDDIWDYVITHPEEYEQIRDLVPLPEML
jgi:hypothetical protein